MNYKSNKILLYIILLLFFVYICAQQFLHMDNGKAFTLIAGCAFLLLYHTKRYGWALGIGIYLFFSFSMQLLAYVPFIGESLKGSYVFFALGVTFFALHHNRNNRFVLSLACCFSMFGIYLTLSKWFFAVNSSILLLCTGAAFLAYNMYTGNRKKGFFAGISLSILGIWGILIASIN